VRDTSDGVKRAHHVDHATIEGEQCIIGSIISWGPIKSHVHRVTQLERTLDSLNRRLARIRHLVRTGGLTVLGASGNPSPYAGIFKAAVRDRRVTTSPCEGARLPKRQPKRVEPLSTEAVAALLAAVPDRYRTLFVLAAGTGMRQGEVFGLTVDRINFLRRHVTVDRQLILVPGKEPFLAPPKTAASNRTIPLPQVVVDALAAHLAAFPAGPEGFVFTTEAGKPIRRTAFSAQVWQPAAHAAGLPPVETFHGLRHHYASLLIRHGESVKTVQARLGHASASETLDTYSHLWPDSEERTREAVDEAWRGAVVPPVCPQETAMP
jgi:integrase